MVQIPLDLNYIYFYFFNRTEKNTTEDSLFQLFFLFFGPLSQSYKFFHIHFLNKKLTIYERNKKKYFKTKDMDIAKKKKNKNKK